MCGYLLSVLLVEPPQPERLRHFAPPPSFGDRPHSAPTTGMLARALATPLRTPLPAPSPPPPPPQEVEVRKGDTLCGVAKAHGVSVRRLQALNGLCTDTIKVGMQLVVKDDTWVSTPRGETGPRRPQEKLLCPVVGDPESYISSGFGERWGRRHEGLDLAAVAGTPVVAASNGVVRATSFPEFNSALGDTGRPGGILDVIPVGCG